MKTVEKIIHKIDDVQAKDDLKLNVRFKSGEVKLYDMKPLIAEIQAFEILREDVQLFQIVQVASGGYGVIWNEELDLSGDELWHNGQTLI
jgi:hypothetical protein